MFAAKYQLKRVTILNCASFHSLCCLMNRKCKYLNKQCFYWNNKMFCDIKLQRVFEWCLSALTQSHSRFGTRLLPRLFSFTRYSTRRTVNYLSESESKCRCLKSGQKSAAQLCQVATVVMETTQLVRSQFKHFLSQSMENWIRYLCAKKCCELCDIICSSPVFLRHTVEWLGYHMLKKVWRCVKPFR